MPTVETKPENGGRNSFDHSVFKLRIFPEGLVFNKHMPEVTSPVEPGLIHTNSDHTLSIDSISPKADIPKPLQPTRIISAFTSTGEHISTTEEYRAFDPEFYKNDTTVAETVSTPLVKVSEVVQQPQQAVVLEDNALDTFLNRLKTSKIGRLFGLGTMVGGTMAGAAACAPSPEPITPPAIVTPAEATPTLNIPVPTATEVATAVKPTVTEVKPTTVPATPTIKKVEATPTISLEASIGVKTATGGGAWNELLGTLDFTKYEVSKAGFETNNPGNSLLVTQDYDGKALPNQNVIAFTDKAGKAWLLGNFNYPKPKDSQSPPYFNTKNFQNLIGFTDNEGNWSYHIPIMAPAGEGQIPIVYLREGKYYQGLIDTKTGKIVPGSEKNYWTLMSKDASQAQLVRYENGIYVVVTTKDGKTLDNQRVTVATGLPSREPEATATKEVQKVNFDVSIESQDPRWPRKTMGEWFKDSKQGPNQFEDAVMKAMSQAVSIDNPSLGSKENILQKLKDGTAGSELSFNFYFPKGNRDYNLEPILIDPRKGVRIVFRQGLDTGEDPTVIAMISKQFYKFSLDNSGRLQIEIDNGYLLDQPALTTTDAMTYALVCLSLRQRPTGKYTDPWYLQGVAPEVMKALNINFDQSIAPMDNWLKASRDSIFK